MKPVWTACVLIFLCLYEIDKFQLTASEVKTLDLPAGVKGNIMCGDNSVIRIDNVTVHAYESYCATNMSNACILADDDFNSIKTLCNDNIACTIDFPKNTSCLKQDRYFNLSYSCLAETSTVISTTNHDSEPSTVMSTQIEDSAETSTVISTQIHNSASNPMYTIIIVSVLVIVLIALGVITVVCYRRKTAKLSQPIGTRQDETANNMTDSMDYTAINYNEMRDIDITKINENKKAKITTNRDLPGNNASAEKEENNYNKYESLSTIRISGEHIYESGCAHDNQYQSLTNQRELDEHSYESTEHALSQYQLLTNRSESDNHAYESTSLHTDELQNKK